MIVKYSDRNFLIANPTRVHFELGFPPHPRGVCFGPSSAAFRSHVARGLHRALPRTVPSRRTNPCSFLGILMQIAVQVFIKTTQKIPAALIEGLIQSAAGLLFKVQPVSLGTCAGAHAGNCHPKTQRCWRQISFGLCLFILPAACFYLAKARGKSALQQALQRISLFYVTLGSGFKQQCRGVATTKSKAWERPKSRGLLYVRCVQAMHHCSLSVLADVPALLNLISLSSYRFIFAEEGGL